MSFTSSKTKIEGLLSKKEQIIDVAAKNVADVVILAKKENKLSISYEKNLFNLLEGFDTDEKSKILTRACIYTAMGTSTTDDDEEDDNLTTSYFGRRHR